MNYIAHRGNIAGINPERENTISYINEALAQLYWVEVDVQCVNGDMYFGHDYPQERVDIGLIMHPCVICHAKDIEALDYLLEVGAHCFWHQKDTVTLTSQQFIWCYPGTHMKNSRAIWLDLHNNPLPHDISNIFGICADDFTKY